MACEECDKSRTTHRCSDCGTEYCTSCAEILEMTCECVRGNILTKAHARKVEQNREKHIQKVMSKCKHDEKWYFRGECVACVFMEAQDVIDAERKKVGPVAEGMRQKVAEGQAKRKKKQKAYKEIIRRLRNDT